MIVGDKINEKDKWNRLDQDIQVYLKDLEKRFKCKNYK